MATGYTRGKLMLREEYVCGRTEEGMGLEGTAFKILTRAQH